MSWLLDIVLSYLLLYGSCWAHEFGHAIMATLLIARPQSIWVSWTLAGQTVLIYPQSK